jgi:hypothetical protein
MENYFFRASLFPDNKKIFDVSRFIGIEYLENPDL